MMGKMLIVLFQLCITPQQFAKVQKMTVIDRINECKRLIYSCSDDGGKFSQSTIDDLMYMCDGGL